MSNLLEQILNSTEGKTLEFKRDLTSPSRLLKSIVAFSNTAGGKLIIGITDDKRVFGVQNPLDEEERLCSLIADAISPRLIPNIELLTVESKTVVVVEVFLSNSRPHWINSEGSEDGVYVRLGSTNRKADKQLIAELRRSVEGVAYDELPMPELSISDLDLIEIKNQFSEKKQLNENMLLTMKLLTKYQNRIVPTIGSVLLFGKERTRYFGDAWVQCGRFIGNDKAKIFDQIEITESLPVSVDEVILFLKKHSMRSADLSNGIRRKDIWSIPLSILREVIVNALVHCDYSQRGAPIRVSFFDDRIEVENPGILLPGMTIEDMIDGVSKIRNPVIARVFRELGLIEQWGSGVMRVFQEAKSLGLPPLAIVEVGTRIRFTIPFASPIKVTYDVGKVAQSMAQSMAQSEAILKALEVQTLSSAELAGILGLPTKSGTLKRTLKELLESKKIEYTIPEKPNSRLQKYRIVKSK